MNDGISLLGNLLSSFQSPENDVRAAAENSFFELLNKDPNTTMNLLFTFILENPSSIERKHALIRAKSYLYKISTQNVNTLTPETFQFITSAITQLLQNLNSDKIEIEFIFLIIQTLINPLIIPGHWPEIFNIMWSLSPPFLPFVITFFSQYLLSAITINNLDHIPQDVIQRLPELVKFDYPDPEACIASISLAFHLLMANQGYFQVLALIPQAIYQLPDALIDRSINIFEGFFQTNWMRINEYLSGFLAIFLQIIHNTERLDSCRISSLEIIDKMLIRAPSVRRFLTENLTDFLQTLLVCFIANDTEDPIYNLACILLEDFVSDRETEKIVLANICPNFPTLPVQVVSAFIRYLPKVQFINQIVQFCQSPDPIISKNAFDTMDILLEKKYTKLVKLNPNIAQILSDLLFNFVDVGRADAVFPLARLAEMLSVYNKEKLRLIAPKLLQVHTKILNSDSIRCAAAVAEAFPEEVSTSALNLANLSMKLIIDGIDEDSTYALMIAVSTFAKCMPPDNFKVFILQLMELVKDRPETSMFKGLRIIAKQIGESFAQFIPLFIQYLINISTQEIEYYYQQGGDESFDSSYMVVALGSSKMSFRNEQLAEITNALEAIADYVDAVGSAFTPFYDQAAIAANYAIKIIFDSQIRIAAVNLYLALANCIPSNIPNIFGLLLDIIITNDDPEVEVQQAIMTALQTIVENELCPQEVRIRYLQAIPGILTSVIATIRKDIADDEFEGVEDEFYLNLLWSIAFAFKFLYSACPQESGAAFIQCSSIFQPFNQETVLVLNQFAMALWTDFLIFGPDGFVAQCEQMVPQVVQMVNHPDKDIRRMALYAIGRIFEKRDMPPQEIDKLLGVLYVAATSEAAQNDEELFEGNDNALSSYALLLRKRIPMGNATEDIQHFIEMFPAEDDLEEVKIAYDFLFDLLWQSGSNQEIGVFLQPICEKLIEGIEIEAINKIVNSIIEEKIGNGNIPPHVSQFLSMIQ